MYRLDFLFDVPMKTMPDDADALARRASRRNRARAKRFQQRCDALGSGSDAAAAAFDALAFSGGGVRCLAFVGGVQELHKRDRLSGVRRVSGTSGGALVATMVAALHLDVERMQRLALDVDFTRLCDSGGWRVREAWNVARSAGANTGDGADAAFGEFVRSLTGDADATFAHVDAMHGVRLAIVATSLTDPHRPYVFASHLNGHASTPVRVALRASTALPYVFAPLSRQSGVGTADTFVDGGIVDNVPVHAFCEACVWDDDDDGDGGVNDSAAVPTAVRTCSASDDVDS